MLRKGSIGPLPQSEGRGTMEVVITTSLHNNQSGSYIGGIYCFVLAKIDCELWRKKKEKKDKKD